MKIPAKDNIFEPFTDGTLSTITKEPAPSKFATSIVLNDESGKLFIDFEDQSRAEIKIADFDEFKDLSTKELRELYIGFAGQAICHDEKDLHVYIPGILQS